MLQEFVFKYISFQIHVSINCYVARKIFRYFSLQISINCYVARKIFRYFSLQISINCYVAGFFFLDISAYKLNIYKLLYSKDNFQIFQFSNI